MFLLGQDQQGADLDHGPVHEALHLGDHVLTLETDVSTRKVNT